MVYPFVQKSRDFGVQQNFFVPEKTGTTSGFAFKCAPDTPCDISILDIEQAIMENDYEAVKRESLAILTSQERPAIKIQAKYYLALSNFEENLL